MTAPSMRWISTRWPAGTEPSSARPRRSWHKPPPCRRLRGRRCCFRINLSSRMILVHLFEARLKMKISAFATIVLLLIATVADSAEWQWSAPVDSVKSSETDDHPRAFLWIPPNCQHLRAVVVGQHNMEEEPILEHPVFRKTLAEIGFAEIWITP